jgi:CRISPR-associated protein Cas2
MRHAYMVSYDISNPKRLRKVFKAMHGFGNRMQYSVFRCELSDADRVRMISKLSALIHHAEDQVLIVNLGPAPGRSDGAIEAIGRKPAPIERTPVVV